MESIHGKNIVNGDIKSSCFHYGKNDGKIYLIDFGFSFEFMNGFSHIPFQQVDHSLSDKNFCSRNVCKSYQKSRRDDIESLGYVLIYLMTGFLPWESSNNHMNIVKFKLSIVLDSLCYGLSNNIRQFINYAWNLKFEEKPDYNYLRNLINNNIKPNLNLKLKNLSFKNESSHNDKIDNSADNDSLIQINEDFEQINNKEFNCLSNKTNSGIDKKDLNIIETLYVKNKNSQILNTKLRNFGPIAMNEEDIKLYDALMEEINFNKTSKNYLVYRFVNNDFLESVFGIFLVIIFIII